MSDKIYFQWQNEHLLNTIYPLREMKLADFLVYYYEIDLWAEYKDKTLEDIKPELDAFQAAQESQWASTFQKYKELREYILEEDVSDRYRKKLREYILEEDVGDQDCKEFSDLDQTYMEKINAIHRSFKKYFPAYNDPRKERIFLTGQISRIEKLHKQVRKEVADKKRAIRNMGSDWGKTPAYQKISIN